MRPVWLVLAFILSVAVTTPNSLAHSELVLIPGSLRDPGSMGPTGKYRMCSPLVLGLNQWQADWITRLIRPSDDQKERLRVLSQDNQPHRSSLPPATIDLSRATRDDRKTCQRTVRGVEDHQTELPRLLSIPRRWTEKAYRRFGPKAPGLALVTLAVVSRRLQTPLLMDRFFLQARVYSTLRRRLMHIKPCACTSGYSCFCGGDDHELQPGHFGGA